MARFIPEFQDFPLRIEGPPDTVEALLGLTAIRGVEGEIVKVGDEGWAVEQVRLSAGFDQGITMMVDLRRVHSADEEVPGA